MLKITDLPYQNPLKIDTYSISVSCYKIPIFGDKVLI
jgi:hypothetical protein